MKKKTSELSGVVLDYVVATCEGFTPISDGISWIIEGNDIYKQLPKYSTGWGQGGPILERESISIIRLDNKSIPDSNGFWQGKYISRWAAVIGDQHSMSHVYGPQGDDYGDCYAVEATAIVGETPLIAAMRCYVARKLGDEVEVPEAFKEVLL